MDILRRSAFTVISLVLIALSILAIYNTSQIISLRLPINTAGTVFSLFLPMAELAGIVWLSLSAQNWTNTAINISWVLSVLDGALITLASSQINEQTMGCLLETVWLAWFQGKNSRAIRGVQNSLECCGLRSPVDKAWPFPNAKHGADACQGTYGRNNGCFDGWAYATRKGLLIFVTIGVVSLVVKVSIGIAIQVGVSSSERSRLSSMQRNRERQALLSTHEDGETESRNHTEETSRTAHWEHNA